MRFEQIVSEVNAILAQYTMRLTLRQIFYRLVSKLVIPNTVSSYKRLSRILVRAREEGLVDERRIEDRSRQVLGLGDFGYDDFDSFLDERIQRLKDSWKYWFRPLWETQPRKVLIALEKDALSRLFTDVADEYNVNVFPTRGYGSYTYVRQMAGRLDGEKPNVVLYFGDYDPSGRDIERDLDERLFRYGAVSYKVIRVAIKPDQIAQYNLPPRPEDAETLAKLARDPRTRRYGIQYAVELDAIEPNELQRIIKEAIVSQIDEDLWNQRVEQIEDERKKLAERLSKLKIEWGD